MMKIIGAWKRKNNERKCRKKNKEIMTTFYLYTHAHIHTHTIITTKWTWKWKWNWDSRSSSSSPTFHYVNFILLLDFAFSSFLFFTKSPFLPHTLCHSRSLSLSLSFCTILLACFFNVPTLVLSRHKCSFANLWTKKNEEKKI